ncbi:Protein kinase domain-containing protein [Psidium guajava]|nr:Protein kinase domain-containing protein [Psidium guajava]
MRKKRNSEARTRRSSRSPSPEDGAGRAEFERGGKSMSRAYGEDELLFSLRFLPTGQPLTDPFPLRAPYSILSVLGSLSLSFPGPPCSVVSKTYETNLRGFTSVEVIPEEIYTPSNRRSSATAKLCANRACLCILRWPSLSTGAGTTFGSDFAQRKDNLVT